MTELDLRPEILLPHDHPMILIDSVIGFGNDYALATVTPAPGKPFANQEGDVPSWVGMEYMAQTIGAYAGIMAQRSGQPVKVGFLLGTRSYDINLTCFQCGQTYAIEARKTYEDGCLSAFECKIVAYPLAKDGESVSLAMATINTFQPDNIDEFIEAGKA